MHQPGYQAYTLRLSPGGTEGVWRVTLYSAQTGERWRFGDLEQLHAFLCRAVAPAPAYSNDPVDPVVPDKAEE